MNERDSLQKSTKKKPRSWIQMKQLVNKNLMSKKATNIGEKIKKLSEGC